MVYVKTMNRDKKKEAKKAKEANGREKMNKNGEGEGKRARENAQEGFFLFLVSRLGGFRSALAGAVARLQAQ